MALQEFLEFGTTVCHMKEDENLPRTTTLCTPRPQALSNTPFVFLSPSILENVYIVFAIYCLFCIIFRLPTSDKEAKRGRSDFMVSFANDLASPILKELYSTQRSAVNSDGVIYGRQLQLTSHYCATIDVVQKVSGLLVSLSSDGRSMSVPCRCSFACSPPWNFHYFSLLFLHEFLRNEKSNLFSFTVLSSFELRSESMVKVLSCSPYLYFFRSNFSESFS